jgi:hypothetical protein
MPWVPSRPRPTTSLPPGLPYCHRVYSVLHRHRLRGIISVVTVPSYMNSKSILSILLVLSLAEISSGCGQAIQATNDDAKRKEEYTACVKIQAEIAGLDAEIRLRIDRLYDVKWRMKAFGSVGHDLYKQMLEDDEKIIQARVKRANAVYRAQQVGENCYTPLDSWDAIISKNDCLRPEREDKFPDGFGLVDRAGCEAQYQKDLNKSLNTK